MSYRTASGEMSPQFLTSRNSLDIVNTESLWDKIRKQIVYLIKTNQMITGEIEIGLKDELMSLEAPLMSSYNQPFRTHKVGKESQTDIEEGITVIGFSELRLKPGYQYSLISSQVINPNLIKVVLGFSPENVSKKN